MNNMAEVITKFRELQGLSCADVDRACGFSPGSLSRFEKGRPKSLATDRIEQALEHLHIMVTDGKVRFRDGSFIKVLLSDDALLSINYSRLHFILDMYKDKRITVYVHRSTTKNVVDRVVHKAYPVAPSDALFIKIEDLLFLVKRKWGSYLLEMRDLIDRLKREYRNIVITEIESDADVNFDRITREGIERIIQDSRPVVSRGLRKR